MNAICVEAELWRGGGRFPHLRHEGSDALRDGGRKKPHLVLQDGEARVLGFHGSEMELWHDLK